VGCPVLVYTGGSSRRFSDIAVAAGLRYGARLPSTVHHPLWFADQDWRKPNRSAYMRALAQHRPTVATVLDWEREEQLPEVLDWAEEASQYTEYVAIIPKVVGGIGRLPRRIGGRDVLLGYSVNCGFGGTSVPLWEWDGWPIHLLGGSPQRQMHIWRYLTATSEVVSVDGNMTQKLAGSHCMFWVPGTARYARNRYWPQLQEAGDGKWGHDAPYEAFRRSCENIKIAWERLTLEVA
jgi:hypothetical protein